MPSGRDIICNESHTQKISRIKESLSKYIKNPKLMEDPQYKMLMKSEFNLNWPCYISSIIDMIILNFQKDLLFATQYTFDSIRELKKLYDEGIITKEEFDKTKLRLLEKIQ